MISNKIYASSLSSLLGEIQSGAENKTDLGGFVNTIISVAIPLSAICVFLLLAFAAYKLMTSGGNPDKLRDAREQITNAIIGFVFIILSVVILIFLSKLLNIQIEGY